MGKKFTSLCQNTSCGLSCYGCCGYEFGSREDVHAAVQENTKEFEEHLEQHDTRECACAAFRDRHPQMFLRSGACTNLITDGETFFCAIHPAQNDGKEYREKHCDLDHLCTTAKQFASWDSEKQMRFLQFLKEQNLDNHSYSIGIDQGRLLRKFQWKEKREQKLNQQ